MNKTQSATVNWIILDRDGVINHDSPNYIKSADEWIPIQGSIQAIAHLYQHGYKIVVATNQSGLGRGYYTQRELQAMHIKMCTMVEDAGGKIEGIFYCPHTPEDQCQCRKPKVGLLEDIEKSYNIQLAGAYFVGDSLKDIQAGMGKHCQPILVKTGKGLTTLESIKNNSQYANVRVFDNLADFTQSLLP